MVGDVMVLIALVVLAAMVFGIGPFADWPW